MAQGNITQILSSKPEDRRMIFEEATGITKFKSQKRESLRKLEATEQNLLRIADLIREVKRQIGSLQRQAGKAKRYKQIQTELQHLDTQLDETVETGLIKAPGAVAPFLAASALLGPYGAGLLFTADFASNTRRELVQSGIDADQARKIAVMAAPLKLPSKAFRTW